VLAGNQAARASQGVRGAGHGEVLPPRFLREPRQGQHQLTEHRVPAHGLLEPGREVQTQIELGLAGRQTIPSGCVPPARE
jgi:hypothetical protein